MNDARQTWRLETRTVTVPGAIVVSARGRIGSVTAPAFANAIATARRLAASLVIDFEEVDYISGPGIAALLEAAVGNGGTRTIVCGLSDAVRITLELSGALKTLTIADSREDAVRRLQGFKN